MSHCLGACGTNGVPIINGSGLHFYKMMAFAEWESEAILFIDILFFVSRTVETQYLLL